MAQNNSARNLASGNKPKIQSIGSSVFGHDPSNGRFYRRDSRSPMGWVELTKAVDKIRAQNELVNQKNSTSLPSERKAPRPGDSLLSPLGPAGIGGTPVSQPGQGQILYPDFNKAVLGRSKLDPTVLEPEEETEDGSQAAADNFSQPQESDESLPAIANPRSSGQESRGKSVQEEVQDIKRRVEESRTNSLPAQGGISTSVDQSSDQIQDGNLSKGDRPIRDADAGKVNKAERQEGYEDDPSGRPLKRGDKYGEPLQYDSKGNLTQGGSAAGNKNSTPNNLSKQPGMGGIKEGVQNVRNRAASVTQAGEDPAEFAQKKAQQAAQRVATDTAKKIGSAAAKGAVNFGGQLARMLISAITSIIGFLIANIIPILIGTLVIAILIGIVSTILSILPFLGDEEEGGLDPSQDYDGSTCTFISALNSPNWPQFSGRFTDPGESEECEALATKIETTPDLRSKVDQLLAAGLRLKASGQGGIVDDNSIYKRITWLWAESGAVWGNPNAVPDWYFYNCDDRPGISPQGIPLKFDLSIYCGIYTSGDHQVAAFQLGDRRNDLQTAYQACFGSTEPNALTLQQIFNSSATSAQPAWNYKNPAYNGRLDMLWNGDIATQTLSWNDFYPQAMTHRGEALARLVSQHPCMAMFLNSAADSWSGWNDSWGNGLPTAAQGSDLIKAIEIYAIRAKISCQA